MRWLLIGFATLMTSAAQAQDVPRWTLREELRIGDLDDPRYTLSWMRNVVIGSDGSVYVTQPAESTIKVYDRSGRFVRSIGRKGSGPGEFDGLGEVGFVGDTLFALSASNQLMHLFLVDGEHLRSFRFPYAVINDPALHPSRFTMLMGRILVDGSLLANPRLGGTGERPPSPVLRVTREGRIINVIARRQFGSAGNLTLRQGEIGLIMHLPFSVSDLIALPPKGDVLVLVSGRPPATQKDTSFSVSRIALNGATVFQRWIRYRPIPLERRQIDSMIVATVREAGRGRFNPQAHLESAAQQMPKFLPPVTDVVAGADGSTWIRREETRGPAAWLVLDSKGNTIAQLTLPRTFTLKAADATHVWATITDELDIPYVVRYRIVQR
ncbi:MAG: 6-bladed beta-propeller [Gemmatimonadota bacterium]